MTRARILLKMDEGWTAPQTAAALEVSERTVFRTKRRYVEEGLEEGAATPIPGQSVPEGGRAGGGPPDRPGLQSGARGHEHWTLRLLAEKTVELGLVESVSPETVRLRLKKTRSSRGRRSSGAFPR